MTRCGFRSKGVFKMDGSKRSGHGNAFFTGIGRSKRIVLFDTLIAHLTSPESKAVLAHETGHVKMRHLLKRSLANLIISLRVLLLFGWLHGQSWLYEGFGIDPDVFFFQAEDGIRDLTVTGVQTCALPI